MQKSTACQFVVFNHFSDGRCSFLGSHKPPSETCFEQSQRGSLPGPRSPEDRHLNGSYWVQHLVIHNLTGLPNRAHSCSHFDKRSHLTSRLSGQLVALYCQDEKADVGPVASRLPAWWHTWQLRPLEIWRISGGTWHAVHTSLCSYNTQRG